MIKLSNIYEKVLVVFYFFFCSLVPLFRFKVGKGGLIIKYCHFLRFHERESQLFFCFFFSNSDGQKVVRNTGGHRLPPVSLDSTLRSRPFV